MLSGMIVCLFVLFFFFFYFFVLLFFLLFLIFFCLFFSSFSNVGGILRAQDFSSCCSGSCTLLLWTLKELALSEHAVGAVSFCRP